jgi:hypothetical protein
MTEQFVGSVNEMHDHRGVLSRGAPKRPAKGGLPSGDAWGRLSLVTTLPKG